VKVAELWRYSVKSLRGERLDSVDVLADGLRGDRSTQVVDHKGARMTGRTAKRLLGLQSGLGEDGEPTVDGHSWRSDEALGLIREAAGPGADLAPLGRHFDDRSILVTTDGAIGALGVDGRRLRPNIFIEGVEGLAENDWVGSRLRLGSVELDVVDRCERCVMTTIDPDTL
jgi:MOSC domain-containing protein